MTSKTSIATIGIYLGALFCFTIQNNQDIEDKVYECGGTTISELIMPARIVSRVPAARLLNPIREIHCINSDAIRFPMQSKVVLHDRDIITFRKEKNAYLFQGTTHSLGGVIPPA